MPDPKLVAAEARNLSDNCKAFADVIDPQAPPGTETNVTTLIVAIHGIGDQKRFATIQSVAHRLGRYLDEPGMVPLGQFHSSPAAVQAYSFPNHPQLGMAEVFWADIPKEAQRKEDTLEETKAWALTVVERLRMRDRQNQEKKAKASGKAQAQESVDYAKTRAVVSEMIETIATLENLSKLPNNLGLGKFELKGILDDYLGDVQIVADFPDYGARIFEQVGKIMSQLTARHQNVENIYIVAHSEGTVVAFHALLTALASQSSAQTNWVKKVRGFMTIGSPIDKHLVMWPHLWTAFENGGTLSASHVGASTGKPIVWWNYYDYGDPVGFELDSARLWLEQNGWRTDPAGMDAEKSRSLTLQPGQVFAFGKKHDVGFTRYPWPGKAHNDYWDDAAVFDHFFRNVMGLKRRVRARDIQEKIGIPRTKPVPWVVSWIVPYVLCFLLLATGTYLLYKGLVPFLHPKPPAWGEMAKSVLGIASLLAGITVMSRIMRLMQVNLWYLVSVAVFALGSWAFVSGTQPDVLLHLAQGFEYWLGSAFDRLGPTPEWRVVGVGAVVALVGAAWSKLQPTAGMRPLMCMGGAASLLAVSGMIKHPDVWKPAELPPLWPLILAGLAFLFLWHLAALIFDLVFVWHRYIRSSTTGQFLKENIYQSPS